MKKVIIIVGIIVCCLTVIGSFSYGLVGYNNQDIYESNNYTKEELYQMIIDKNINYNDKKLLNILSNWYSYYDKEEMFLTMDGEYVDFVTYEIYRVHLENIYKDNKKKILKNLLKFGNFPKQENSEKYDKYINEYKRTTGKDI